MTGKENLILIVPIGPVDSGTLTALGSALRDVFRLPVKRGKMLQIPSEAYNDERRQYNSSVILDMLKLSGEPQIGLALVTGTLPNLQN